MTRDEYVDRCAARILECCPEMIADAFHKELAGILANCRAESGDPFETPEDDADDELAEWDEGV